MKEKFYKILDTVARIFFIDLMFFILLLCLKICIDIVEYFSYKFIFIFIGFSILVISIIFILGYLNADVWRKK